MYLKSQEILVLMKVAAEPGAAWTFEKLGKSLFMSSTEANESVKRAIHAGLATRHSRTQWSVNRQQFCDFLIHGARHAFAPELGRVRRGVATAHAVSPLREELLAVGENDTPVWPHPLGTARGMSVQPLFHSVAEAALADPVLHQNLALVDALRIGRARERELAARFLRQRLLTTYIDVAGIRVRRG